jgi:hypothetical protein
MLLGVSAAALLLCNTAAGAIVTFDDFVQGEDSLGFDADADGITDVIFSTPFEGGFNAQGPGPNQSYVNEPGLAAMASLFYPDDLRVNFLYGATNSIGFGFALNSSTVSDAYFAELRLFNSAGTEIAYASVPGAYTPMPIPGGRSHFPEGRVVVNFSDVASYGLFNFGAEFNQYIIDNFEGSFGSTERVPEVPEPATSVLMGLGVAAIAAALAGARSLDRVRL